MENVSKDIIIELEVEENEVVVDLDIEKAQLDLDERTVQILRPIGESKFDTIYVNNQEQPIIDKKVFITVDKSTVSLQNVDNTSDLDKPISTAVRAALTNKWFDFEIEDWIQLGNIYKIEIPFTDIMLENPYVDSMLILENESTEFENSIPTWKRLANDNLVVSGDTPVRCKILIKGDI